LKTFVIDGSTILGVVLKDEHSSFTSRTIDVLEGHPLLHVPIHWWLEATNGLLMAERRKRVSRADVSEALNFIRALPVLVDDQPIFECAGDTLALARQYTLTIYDAAYLELAIRRRSVLATVDKALVRAATAAGVELLR
jgi:predicted nucleic acid-binding protein